MEKMYAMISLLGKCLLRLDNLAAENDCLMEKFIHFLAICFGTIKNHGQFLDDFNCYNNIIERNIWESMEFSSSMLLLT